jgi:hypothetical protein
MKTFAKAIAGAITGGLAALASQLEATESFGSISDLGWVLTVSAVVGGFILVYFTPNSPPTP